METKEDLIKETIQKLLRITKMYSRIEKLPIPVDEGLEVTTSEAHTIQALGEHEQMSVTQVASYFGISKSAASQMVAKLAKRGFLVKKQAPHSNKEFQLFLTPLGWRVFHAHERFHGKDMADLVDRLSAFSLSQIATISVLLEAIGSVMDRRLSGRTKG
ncbi:MAG: MarR family transcriptional regulator [Thermodesulfobacteriota bacterium]|nr:MarR family transcriptional regulator [Thermodesulfobacteriota bacterium]